MKKYEPIHPEKINLINNLLQDPIVNSCWLRFVQLAGAPYKERERAFQEYCHFRDKFLGFPPLKIQGIQGTNRERTRNIYSGE